MNKKLLINDAILIAVMFITLIAAAFFIYSPASSSTVSVICDNKLYNEYDLKIDTEEEIADTGVILVIRDKKAYIKDSDCPDKVCMGSLSIGENSAKGASIVCLPNKVALIKDCTENGKEADAIAG